MHIKQNETDRGVDRKLTMRATNKLASQPLVPWCSVTVLLSMGTVDVKQLLLHQVQRQNITASLPVFKRHWRRDPFCRNLVRPLKLRSNVTPVQPEPWQTEWVWGEPSMSMSNTCGYNKSYNIVLPKLLLCLPMKTSRTLEPNVCQVIDFKSYVAILD